MSERTVDTPIEAFAAKILPIKLTGRRLVGDLPAETIE